MVYSNPNSTKVFNENHRNDIQMNDYIKMNLNRSFFLLIVGYLNKFPLSAIKKTVDGTFFSVLSTHSKWPNNQMFTQEYSVKRDIRNTWKTQQISERMESSGIHSFKHLLRALVWLNEINCHWAVAKCIAVIVIVRLFVFCFVSSKPDLLPTIHGTFNAYIFSAIHLERVKCISNM